MPVCILDFVNQENLMYDNGLYEMSQAHQEEMQRQAAKARRGIEIHGTPHHVDQTLPLWVSKLLAHSPFGHHKRDTAKGQPSAN